MTRSDGIGNRLAGALHQLDTGHAAGDRQPVGFAPFRRVVRSSIMASGLIAFGA